MRGPINVKSPYNITNWQMRFNSAFKGLMYVGLYAKRLLFSPILTHLKFVDRLYIQLHCS
jgi:hypothetical protein